MADRSVPDWPPISRNVVRSSLSRRAIPPLKETTDVELLDGSIKYQWVRFQVRFSRLSIERLPMIVDEKTRLYMDDEPRLAHQIVGSFIELVTDMFIKREGKWHYIAQFTLYTNTVEGHESYRSRVSAIRQKTPWEVWATNNR